MDIITAAANVYALGTKLFAISEKIKDAEAKDLIGDLKIALAVLKGQVAELMEEKNRLNEELRKTRAALDEAKFAPKPVPKPLSPEQRGRDAVVARDGMYFLKDPEDGYAEGPYCTACMDGKRKLSLLRPLSGPFRAFGTHECPVCQAHFGRSRGF